MTDIVTGAEYRQRRGTLGGIGEDEAVPLYIVELAAGLLGVLVVDLAAGVNHAYAEENYYGVVWRGMRVSPQGNENMQHKLLSGELCLYLELMEYVCGMRDLDPLAYTEYQTSKFLQR
ncbi:hypothetical protein OS493_011003 [Desmophyllum pertusum]|uniref:Uncharacterized protein n=1 Tax=Desmophyllum pertusum TaxID=174260 RepID=A0A9W9ZET9_9CNID|nr:hypothetical protein OS493_011003 [Desmophyllum pertusum]